MLAGLLLARPWGVERALASEPELPTAERVEALRIEADREFSAGNHRAALDSLLEGYRLSRDPRFVFNLGVTYHWLGECELARDSYARYLRESANGPHRDKAARALEALAPVCGRAPASQAAPSLAPQSVAPLAPQAVAPLAPQAAPSLTPQAPPMAPRIGPAPQPSAPMAAPEPDNTWAWSLISAGGVALASAGVTGVLWHEARSDYRDLVARASRGGQAWDACCAARAARLDARTVRYRALSVGLGVGSLALLGAGAVLWRSSASAELSVAAGDGVELRYRLAF